MSILYIGLIIIQLYLNIICLDNVDYIANFYLEKYMIPTTHLLLIVKYSNVYCLYIYIYIFIYIQSIR